MTEIIRGIDIAGSVDIKRTLDTSLERVHEKPEFLNAVLRLIANDGRLEHGVPVVDVSASFTERPIISDGDLLYIGVKDFHNLMRYDSSSSARAGQAGRFGTLGEDREKNIGSVSRIQADSALLAAGYISDELILMNDVLPDEQMCSPLDWLTVDGNTYLVSEEGLTSIDEKGERTTVSTPLLRRPHSVAPLGPDHLLVTATETDYLLVFDRTAGEFVDRLSAWELGLQTSFGLTDDDGQPLRRINAFSDQELDAHHAALRDKHGFLVVRFDRENPFPERGLPTRHQSVHFNSAIAHPDGSILATAFATSTFDPKTGKREQGEGTGGVVLKISSANRATKVAEGLTNPHNVVSLGSRDDQNYFMLTNTGTGRLRIYQEDDATSVAWRVVGELSFATLPHPRFRENEWIQQVVPCAADDEFYLVGCDSSRRGIHIVSLLRRSRQFIRTSDKAVVHRVSYVPNHDDAVRN